MSATKLVLWLIILTVAGLLLIEAMRLLVLKHSIGSYKQYWNKQNLQTTNTDDTLYIALGDSTAQGIGASQPTKGYVGLLAADIAKSSDHPVHVVNLSVTGAKIADVLHDQLPRLQQIGLPSGSLVTIEIGANDLATFEAATYSSQIDELFRQLPPQTIVSDMPYFGGGRAKSYEPAAVRASAIIRQVAAKYNLRVAPLHETTKRYDSMWVYGADFFHPCDRGYVNWYKAFLTALNQ